MFIRKIGEKHPGERIKEGLIAVRDWIFEDDGFFDNEEDFPPVHVSTFTTDMLNNNTLLNHTANTNQSTTLPLETVTHVHSNFLIQSLTFFSVVDKTNYVEFLEKLLLAVLVIGLVLLVIVFLLCRSVFRGGRPTYESVCEMRRVSQTNERARASSLDHSKYSVQGRYENSSGSPATHGGKAQANYMIEKPAPFKPGMNIARWLDLFEIYARQIDPDHWSLVLLSLIDPSCEADESLNHLNSYERLKEQLKNTFSTKQSTPTNVYKANVENFAQFSSRKQKEEESAVHYLICLEEMAKRIFPTLPRHDLEQTIVSIFMGGLTNKKLKTDILRSIASHENEFPDSPPLGFDKILKITKNFETLVYSRAEEEEEDDDYISIASGAVGSVNKEMKVETKVAKYLSSLSPISE